MVTHTNLSAPPNLPQVTFIPKQKMIELYHGGRESDSRFELQAFYFPSTTTIYLRDDWKPDLAGKSVLLHEMGHYLQRSNRVRFNCPAAAEKQAYEWQATWLREQGVTNPYDVMGVDEFTVRILFACPDEE
jgi:hypothetical protein